MDKNLQRTIIALIAIVCIQFIGSCSHDDDELPKDGKLAEKIEGVWKYEATDGSTGFKYVQFLNLRLSDKYKDSGIFQAGFFEAVYRPEGTVYYEYLSNYNESLPYTHDSGVIGNTWSINL